MTAAIINHINSWDIDYCPENDRVIFPPNYNTQVGNIPYGILYVRFYFRVKYELEPYDIPDCVVYVRFDRGIEKLVKHILPPNLDRLYIGNISDREALTVVEADAIPDTVTKLTVDRSVHFEASHLPRDLVKFKLEYIDINKYNHLELPTTLECLSVRCHFNTVGELGDWIRNVNLRKLSYYYATCDYHPPTLESLKTQSPIYVDIDHLDLVTFEVDDIFKRNSYPDTLRTLCTNHIPDPMPRNLEYLYICEYGEVENNKAHISSDSLKILDIRDSEARLGHLPMLEDLIYTHIGSNIDFASTPNLTTVTMYISHRDLDLSFLPDSVIRLDISGLYEDEYTVRLHTIPRNIKALVGDDFDILPSLSDSNIPDNIELFVSMRIDPDLINNSNVKVFCCDGAHDTFNLSSILDCVVFYPIYNISDCDPIFSLEVKHTHYYGMVPLKKNNISPYYHVTELDHIDIGLSCRIPNIYFYEIVLIPRKLPKSACK